MNPLSVFASMGPSGMSTLLMTLVEFLRERRANKDSDRATILDEYREWARRRDHQEIIHLLDGHASAAQPIHAVLVKGVAIAELDKDELAARVRAALQESLKALAPDGWLSATSRSLRPHHRIPLIGRQEELAALRTATDDVVLIGQPGSGKSYLAHELGL